MEIVTSGSARADAYGGRFTGRVELEMLRAADDAGAPDVALVRFADGAVTYWHRHPGGQLLWVVDGTGRIGTNDASEIALAPGTLVAAPPGERHWHGAAAGAGCAVLALTWGTTAWEETPPVA